MEIPEHLYRFRGANEESLRFTEDIFSNCRLYMASLDSLNDPLEGHFTPEFETTDDEFKILLEQVRKSEDAASRKDVSEMLIELREQLAGKSTKLPNLFSVFSFVYKKIVSEYGRFKSQVQLATWYLVLVFSVE